jgi:hypothetical protein
MLALAALALSLPGGAGGAHAQSVITVSGFDAPQGAGTTGALHSGVVAGAYATPSLQISGGTPPYSLCGAVTSQGTCSPPRGTFANTGLSASVVGSTIVFKGTPTEAGGFAWGAAVYDQGLQHVSDSLILTTQIYDDSVTAPSVVPAKPANYYYSGPYHCCVLKAVVSSTHARSGSPAGTVSFEVDGAPEGKAPLNFAYASVPAPTTASARSTTTIDAGSHTLTAVFNSDPPPAGVCWPNYQGMTSNCFKSSSGTTHFTVARSPTVTTLSGPATTPAGAVQFGVQVSNDTAKTGGFAQVDPGTTVELLMDGKVVDTVKVGLVSQPTPELVAKAPPGQHTFLSKYLGDRNELPSVSAPIQVRR